MRVLAYAHTFNDADVIGQMIDAFSRQTRAVDEILVVDNASSDNTLEQPCLKQATVLRLTENTGTSGAIGAGFRYALEKGYDWMWVFDPDGNPATDALEKMLELYAGWPRSQQEETGFLCCLHPEQWRESALRVFSWSGIVPSRPTAGARHYPCEVAWWSGTLYRMAAVAKVGVPNPDYLLDWGEAEYGYRMKKAGYKGYVCQDAPMDSNVRGYASLRPSEITRDDGTTSTVLEHPPFRCYYTARNRLYLAFYGFSEFRPVTAMRLVVTLAKMMTKVMLRSGIRGMQMRAFGRGIWHGVTGNIAARY